MLFKLSNLNSNLALTLGYLNPALNNSALFDHIQPTYDNNPEFNYYLRILTILMRKAPQ